MICLWILFRRFGFAENDSQIKYPVKVVRNDEYHPYMTDPQFRRLIGKQQEYFVETIIKQTHFREFNRAFHRRNRKVPLNKEFWSCINMKAMKQTLNFNEMCSIPVSVGFIFLQLCTLLFVQMSERADFMEKFGDFGFRQEFWKFLSRTCGFTVLNLMQFWDKKNKELIARNKVLAQYHDLGL